MNTENREEQSIVNEEDIKTYYLSVKHKLIDSIDTKCLDLGNDFKSLKVYLNNKKKNEIMTEDGNPIKISYERNKELINEYNDNGANIKGNIVNHEWVKLKNHYKNQGVGKALHKNEMKIYEKNCIKQIQMEAAWEGPIVWSRKPFYFEYKEDCDDLFLRELFMEYVAIVFDFNKNESLYGKMAQYTEFKKIPTEYLKPENEISFTDWIKKTKLLSLSMDMYKNIKGKCND
ncbi:hypothetical protein OAR97_00615 [Arcobacteraceae bacterium]|nr:hypothetical protein [Arcobacteraceae bacterium]